MDTPSLIVGLVIGAVVGVAVGIVIKEFLGGKLTDVTRDNSGRIIEVSERYV